MHESNVALVNAALTERNPVLCNLRITLSHFRLSEELRAVTGLDAGANFHSWAVWGSKKAGVTIRQEDLDQAIRTATAVSAAVGAATGIAAALGITAALPTVAAASWIGLAIAGLGATTGALVGRKLARWSRRRAAALVLEGNKLVLDDIGRQTARFCATFPPGAPIDPGALEAFVAAMKPGPPEAGGQDLLRDAFRLYARAATTSDRRSRHEACYFANCLAILNEHVKLQPYIEGSLPRIVRRCVTERMLTFDVGPLKLAVSHDVPPLDGLHAPATVASLADPRLIAFLDGPDGWDRAKDALVNSRAENWARLRDRMGYIVNLFRCLHLDPGVSARPYDEAAVQAIDGGVVPAGAL